MLKLRFYCTCLAILSFLLSCNGTDDIVDDSIPEEQQIKDTDSPEISVSTIAPEIEKFSEINVVLKDESALETSIFINGIEQLKTSDLEFQYVINPYIIPVGPSIITIESIDASGNSSKKSFDVAIKHLLMTYDYGEEEDARNPQKWIFFNNLDGSPLTHFRATPGVEKVYTDEIVSYDFVYYSIANYKLEIHNNFSNKNLLVTTNKVSLGETRQPITYQLIPSFSDFEHTLELRINLINENDGFTEYWGKSSNYGVFTQGGGGNIGILSFKHDATTPIYARTFEVSADGFFDGKKENYNYMMFNPGEGYIYLELEEEEFQPADGNLVLDIPSHDAGSMNFKRNGYSGAESLMGNVYHLIYETYENENQLTNYYDLPLLPGLNIYRNSLFYKKNGLGYYTQDFDGQLDVNMPNWTLTQDINENMISINANNPEVDLYLVKFTMNDTSNSEDVKYLTWNYRVFGEETVDKMAARLSIPNDVINEIDEDFYRNMDNLQFTRIDAYDYDEYDGYKAYMDWVALIKTRLTPDKYTFRRVSFYNSNISGKRSLNISKNQNLIQDGQQ